MKPKVTIIGAGESGVGASLLSRHKGYDTFVSSRNEIDEKYKFDLRDNDIAFEEGGHTIDSILASSLIVKSPGVPFDIDVLNRARAKKIEVIDEIEFAFRHIKGKIIAVSGTNGKTTVAHLIYHLAKNGGLNVTLAGNVGVSLSRKAIENNKDWYVVEVSSFQLDGTTTFKPHVAILLNITPDHLDRYDHAFQHYIDSKFRLVKNTVGTDYFIYGADDPYIKEGLSHKKILAKKLGVTLTKSDESAAFFENSKMRFVFEGHTFDIPYRQIPLQGTHNCINVMTAILASYTAGVAPHAIQEGLTTFIPLPHRLELVATVRGVRFINDSKATNVGAVLQALENCESSIIWIAGGVDKGNNYDPIRQQVNERVKTLLCLGTNNKKLKDYFSDLLPHIGEAKDMDKAVKMAWENAQRGDVILLSPACSSFDLFDNYEDRGNQFRQAVKILEAAINGKS